MTIGKCRRCGTEFEKKRIGTKYEKKYCTKRCRVIYNATLSYKRNKDKPEFKKKAKIRFDKWRLKNKAHYNKLCREGMRRRKLRKQEKI